MAREDDHSIHNEPHLQGRSELDPSERLIDPDKLVDRKSDAGSAQSVFDEPDILPGREAEQIQVDWTCSNCGYNLRGLMTDQHCPECNHNELYRPPPEGQPAYANWIEERIAATPVAMTWWITWGLVLVSGPWAVLSTLMGDPGVGRTMIMMVVVFGPTIEEIMKIGAALVLVETRPYLFKYRSQVQMSVVAGALGFAVIENLLYLNVYIPNPSTFIVVWRWTVCVALHVGCTLIASRGLVIMWEKAVLERRPPQIAHAVPALATAIIVHGTYNLTMTILEMSGLLYW